MCDVWNVAEWYYITLTSFSFSLASSSGCYANGFVTVQAGAEAAGAGAEYQQDLTPDVYLAQVRVVIIMKSTR